jgi:hypothetical protein
VADVSPILAHQLPDLLAILMGGLIVLIPVLGFTVRFAIKPVAAALAQLSEASGSNRRVAMLEQRIALLEQQLRATHPELTDLLDAGGALDEIDALTAPRAVQTRF